MNRTSAEQRDDRGRSRPSAGVTYASDQRARAGRPSARAAIASATRSARWLVGVVVLWSVFLLPTTLRAAPQSSAIVEILNRFRSWQIEVAEEKLAPLTRAFPDDPQVKTLRGILAFLRGEYRAAVTIFEGLDATRQRLSLVRYYHTMAKGALEMTRQFKSYRSPKGHFVIRYQPGLDEVLLEGAGLALDLAWQKLGGIFDYRPTGPVIVEIYPSTEQLARVTPLTLAEITTSGTIAICKFNRMMIVSPRALVWGYNWLDTLAHEYIHFVITRKTHNSVPVWLHEGLAKFFENRWREEKAARLSLIHEHLLAQALKGRKLISFAKMSPSMAKLPSQAETALAFAEVFTAVQQMYEKGGAPLVRRLLDAMTTGLSDKQAIKQVLSLSFSEFNREWRRWLGAQSLRSYPGLVPVGKLFKGKANDQRRAELGMIKEKEARRFVYLGDLLRARRRYRAAVKEYRKATGLIGDVKPMVQAKLAHAYLELGLSQKAIDTLRAVTRYYPDYFLVNFYLGRAFFETKAYDLALQHLLRAERINPFDIDIHRMLFKVYQLKGDERLAKSSWQKMKILSREQDVK
ncbi:MAG: tetratricopeptide repeat protein [Myxococcales bacterium]|nr:tetratricopeptide repeat protein [Myxococcales bacterium]